jgi:hypothetical protein
VRGHQLGVGDIREMSGESWDFGHPSCDGDCGITERKLEPGLVCGHGFYQRAAPKQSRSDGGGVCDGPRHGPVLCATHEQGPLVTDGGRGNRLGVTDIGCMPSRARVERYATSGDDGGPGQRQCESGMVCGRRCYQPDSTGEPGRLGLGVCDGVWCRDGESAAHSERSGWAHGM